jgi:hypothetical protein
MNLILLTMNRSMACFFAFFLTVPGVFAQVSDQPSSDSGVLVSSSARGPDRDTQTSEGQGNADRLISDNNEKPAEGSGMPSSKSSDDSNKLEMSDDDIVVKATDAVIFQMTANLKLTQDQINAVRPVIMDNIIKVRKLQQSLQAGGIDSKTMVNQREELTKDEDRQLMPILTSSQLKVWIEIQNQYDN